MKRIGRILDPIHDDMVKVSYASKKNMPDKEARLKAIKQGLIAIGSFIIQSCAGLKLTEIEPMMWDFVADRYWPQSKAAENKCTGKKLREMYQKIAEKDNKGPPAAATPAIKGPASATPPVKSGTPKANGTNGTTPSATASSGVKKEEHLVPRKLPDFKREPSSDVKRERPSSKSPEANRENRPVPVRVHSPEKSGADGAAMKREDGEVAE